MNLQEYETDLLDLVKTIVRRWRFILICIIITTVVSSGFCIIKNFSINKSNQEEFNKLKEKSEENRYEDGEIDVDTITKETTLNNSQISDVKVAANMYGAILENYNYFEEESAQASKYNEMIVIQYMIKSKAIDNGISLDLTNSIGKALEQYIVSGGMAKAIASQCDEKESLLDLKNSIRISFTTIESTGEEATLSGKFRTAPVIITCRGKNASQAKNIAEYVKMEVGDFCEKFSQYGECSIEFVDMYEGNEKDLESMIQGIGDISTIYNAKYQFDTFVRNFNDEQKALFNVIAGSQVLETESKLGSTNVDAELVEIPLTSDFKKFSLAGVIAGLFIACIWITMVYILSGTIKTKDDITCMFGYYYLGNLKERKVYKGFGNVIDKFIDKKSEENLISIDDRMTLIISNIKAICKKEELNDIFISSTTFMSNENKIYIDNIISMLNKNGISAYFESNVLTNVAGFDKMTEKKSLILVEKIGESKMKDIEKLSDMCKEYDVNVLGFICI